MARFPLTWLLEREVFASGDCIRDAAIAAGQQVVDWSDNWRSRETLPPIAGPVVFHGSLENADWIARRNELTPGAFCNTDKFHCSAWYPAAAKWLLHPNYEILPAAQLVAQPAAVMSKLGVSAEIFVRPDGPLKPFSGRVLDRNSITLKKLDHGFYYDDPNLLVVVAPVRKVEREWRYVVANRQVIAGSGYIADERKAVPDDPNGPSWQFANEVALAIEPPEAIYVLDVCLADEELRLLELNPFSGADLYACSGEGIVAHVEKVAQRLFDDTMAS